MCSGCGGQLNPEVVESTEYGPSVQASNVLHDDYKSWYAEYRKTTGEGFTIKVDNCKRLISGCEIKNKENGYWATKEFRVSGSLNENGPWRTLIEDELADTRYKSDVDLVDFTFDHPVEIQFLKFEVVSYWGEYGGALQYFAALRVKSKSYFI